MKLKSNRLFLTLFGVVIFMTGCASTGGVKPDPVDSSLIVCPEPRPKMCTMDYRPVCAELADGSFETFSNGCMACAVAEVVGYRNGECAK